MLTKLFGQWPILVGQTTPLTFTITNTDIGPGVGNIGFTDTLPAGLVVAMPNGLSGGCGIGTVTAVAGSNTISLAGGALPLGGTCTFSVNVLATAAGSFLNATSTLTSANGEGNSARALLLVVPLSPPIISKAFADSQIQLLFGSTALSFTITNPVSNPVPLTAIAFTDTLPAGLTVAVPDNGLIGTCGGGRITAVPASNSISLSGATLAPGASCTFSVAVSGTEIGVQSNTTSPITASPGALIGLPATAAVSVVALEFLSFFTEGGGGSRQP